MADIPDDVRRLIASSIASATEVEIILHMRQSQDRDWGAEELARAVHIDAHAAESLLPDLAERGFLAIVDGSPPTYKYQPTTPAFGRAVDRLAEIYPTRRVAIINLIFSRPPEALRIFSDAFRLRREN